MRVRAAVPEDAPAIAEIAYKQGLPSLWTLPPGKHILVAGGETVAAFCALYESPYGLVVDELWELPTIEGFRALSLLSEHIETLAQEVANRRGEAVQCGGIVRVDRERHKRALERRGYSVEGEVLAKVFTPSSGRDIDYSA